VNFLYGKVSHPFVIGKGVRQGRWFFCNTVQLRSSQTPEKPGTNNTISNRLTQICGFADDILVIARSLLALEVLCAELSREAGRLCLVVRPNKTKYMRFSASPFRRSAKGATINGVTYEVVAEFIYLGRRISNVNSVEK
jgi:hypothetical protein